MTNKLPIFVTGASGFVGQQIVSLLAQRGHQVRALVRKTGTLSARSSFITEVPGDILSPDSLPAALGNAATIIHLVGIIKENPPHTTFEKIHLTGTQNILSLAQHNHCRYLHMSALGTRPDARARYHQTKWQAEELVRNSGLNWTIFRPSLILGPQGEFTRMLQAWSTGHAAPYFFMPYFGGGFFGQSHPTHLQPIAVEDVARAFVEALSQPQSFSKTYDLVGPIRYSWHEFLRLASQFYRGQPKLTLGIPAWWAKFLTRLPLPLPFTRDQITMSREDNIGDPVPFAQDFPHLLFRPNFIPS